jgi:hypothetical protein
MRVGEAGLKKTEVVGVGAVCQSHWVEVAEEEAFHLVAASSLIGPSSWVEEEELLIVGHNPVEDT